MTSSYQHIEFVVKLLKNYNKLGLQNVPGRQYSQKYILNLSETTLISFNLNALSV